jgi:hypothetical protein
LVSDTFAKRYRRRAGRRHRDAIEYIEENRLLAGLDGDWLWRSDALPVSDAGGVKHLL